MKPRHENVNKIVSYVLWQDRSFLAYFLIQSILTAVLIGFVITIYQQPPTNLIDSKDKDIGPLLKAVHSEIDKLNRKYEENMASLPKEVQQVKMKLKELETSMKYFHDLVPNLAGKLNWMEQEHSEINRYIVGFLLLIVVCLSGAAYWIVLGKNANKNLGQKHVSSSGQGVSSNPVSAISTKPSILDQIKQKPLLNNIGMVGFNRDTNTLHKSLVDAAKKHCGIQTEVTSTVVQSEDVIPEIPASTVVFIFVDFNDRNIILEDPKTEIRDLRRITTECIMKMRCFVYVVYVGDVNSENLSDHQLYNSGLHSITRHKLLSELQRNDRVLSVYKIFNKYQLESISRVLKQRLSF